MKFIINILNIPIFYTLSQHFLAPGSQFFLNTRIKKLIKKYHHSGLLLDVGCGPKSWLTSAAEYSFLLDISYNYIRKASLKQNIGINGSSLELPFKDNSFQTTWCIGVLHHLSDPQARKSIHEMVRVCKPNGHVIILDAVLPCNIGRRPIAQLIRKNDRGEHMRSEDQFCSLLSTPRSWSINRYTYSLTGLEVIQCVKTNST